jgi:hypothetical protein
VGSPRFLRRVSCCVVLLTSLLGAYSATVRLGGSALAWPVLWAWKSTRSSNPYQPPYSLTFISYTRSQRDTPEARKDDSYCVPGTGDPDGVIPTKWFHGTSTNSINNFLKQDLDILVMCLPLTSETYDIISYEQFEILSKKKTYLLPTAILMHESNDRRFLSSVARGESINTEALIQALENGQIRGAAVDGTDPEPLPSDHPLWKAANLLVTPWVTEGAEPTDGVLLILGVTGMSHGRLTKPGSA